MLPRGVGNGLPFVVDAAFQAKLPKRVDADECLFDRLRGWRGFRSVLLLFQGSTYLWGKLFTDVGTHRAPINDAIGIPVWPMSDAFAAPAATRFSTVTNLLVISDLLIHQ